MVARRRFPVLAIAMGVAVMVVGALLPYGRRSSPEGCANDEIEFFGTCYKALPKPAPSPCPTPAPKLQPKAGPGGPV